MKPIDNFLNSSADYENGLIAWAKEKPKFMPNMHVAVYTNGAKLIGYGKVKCMIWDESYECYLYDVEMYTGQMFTGVDGAYLDRVVWPVRTWHEQGTDFFVVHKGGRA